MAAETNIRFRHKFESLTRVSENLMRAIPPTSLHPFEARRCDTARRGGSDIYHEFEPEAR